MEGEKRRAFNGIFAANFISTFGESLPQSFQPLFLASLGVSPAAIGLFYNIRNVVQTIVRVPVGQLSDRIGHRQLMILGLSLISLVPFLYSVSVDLYLPLFAMLVSGFGISIYYPPSEAYASGLFPPDKVGETMGRFHLGWAISAIIGPVVGGYLATVFPSYRPVFLLASLVTFMSVLVIFAYTRDDRGPGCPYGVSAELSRIFREFPATIFGLLRNRKVAVASIAVFAHSFTNWGVGVFFPLLAYGRGASELVIGAALTANALLMGVTLPLMGGLSDRLGRLTPIVAGLALDLISFSLIPLAPYLWTLPLIMAVKGVGAALVFPVSQAATLEALPAEERGVGTGLWGTIMSLGATIGMFASTVVVAVASIEWAFYFSAAFSLASMAVILILRDFFNG
jgi:DHA1 family multidrug resistance protein-like MFS transporter